MHKKIITGTYGVGYALDPRYSTADIEASGRIAGAGLTATAQARVTNAGMIADKTPGARGSAWPGAGSSTIWRPA